MMQRKRRHLLRRVLCLVLALSFLPAVQATGSTADMRPGLDYYVDFEYLQKVNPDIVAWLYSEDGQLNRPVMQGKNNTYYLGHSFKDKTKKYGEVLLDRDSDPAFGEDVWYFYGTSDEEGPLGPFRDLLKEDNLQRHSGFVLMTEGQNYAAEFFAGYVTKKADETSWRIQTESEAAFEESLNGIIHFPGAVVREECLPCYGEKLLVIFSHNYGSSEKRTALFARLTLMDETLETARDLTKIEMDETETLNGYYDFGSYGEYMIYAQDDPSWDRMRYERRTSSQLRVFGDGGCGPTAAAMAIASLVPLEQLPLLGEYARNETGFTFCSCSINSHFCTVNHVQYHPTTPEEYLRYLPIILANFATGNNSKGKAYRSEARGTNIGFLKDVCDIFKIDVTFIQKPGDAVEYIREGYGTRIAVCSAIKGSPFTSSGHFIVLAFVDDEYAYFLDPLRQNNYKKYPLNKLLEVVAPGVVRVRAEQVRLLNVLSFYVLER